MKVSNMVKFGYRDIKEDDFERVVKVLKFGWLVSGPVAKELELLSERNINT